jgi:transposase
LTEINDENGKLGSLTQEQQSLFQKRYRTILTQGEGECPVAEKKKGKKGKTKQSKSRNLLERLRDYEEETLRFMRDPTVPFTNNQGENDIRMTKVQQKISGCFRSINGARQFCRIRSYISTCRKNGINPTEALKLLFDGKLPTFMT